MDKIYSRKRIRIPELKKLKNKRISKVYFTIVMLTILSITGYKMLSKMDPIFEGLCIAKAQSIATEISNRKSSEVLEKYNYNETVQIIKSDDGKNSILKTDIVSINKIVSDITIEIQKELNNLEKQEIEIPIGALLGNQYFSGMGPSFKIRIISVRRYCNRNKN